MKRTLLTAVLALTMMAGNALSAEAALSNKQKKRLNYTLDNLKLDKQKEAALKPILEAYLAEMKTAAKTYDDMKDKYKAVIKSGSLTEAAADALLKAKWEADEKERIVKMKYEKKFRTVLTAKKTWYCFDLLNDKMSKIDGEE